MRGAGSLIRTKAILDMAKREGKMKIGFIGFGNMATAIIGGLDRKEFPEVYAHDPANPVEKAKKLNVTLLKDNKSVVEKADVVVFAVKPQILDKVLSELESVDFKGKLTISIVAGAPLEKFSSLKNTRTIRTMPNTPALVRKGVTVLLKTEKLSDEDIETAEKIFSSIGEYHWITDEKLMDAVTALSGSGPAYFFTFIEALAMAGVRVGLPYDLSLKLAMATGEGSLALLRETPEPAKLRNMVSSPGGTTITALEVLERSGFRGITMEAVRKAYEKSRELGKK